MKLRKYEREKFIQWLKAHGCEVIPSSNQYESVRWRGREVGVIYDSRKTSGKYASNAMMCFISKNKWKGGPTTTGRNKRYIREKRQIIERDGSDCFYCHKPMGDDITVEHLIELNQGGKNSIGNMVLSHKKCNENVQRMTVVEKVKIAINNKTNK